MLNTLFRAAGLYVTFRGAAATRFGYVCQSNHVFYALAAESIQNGPFSGAAAEKDVASEATNEPVTGGPGASQTIYFPVFLKNEIHPGSASRKFSNLCGGPKVPKWLLVQKETHFRHRLFLRLCESRRQPNKINVWHHFPSQGPFRTLDRPSLFVQARASKTTTIIIKTLTKLIPLGWKSVLLTKHNSSWLEFC